MAGGFAFFATRPSWPRSIGSTLPGSRVALARDFTAAYGACSQAHRGIEISDREVAKNAKPPAPHRPLKISFRE